MGSHRRTNAGTQVGQVRTGAQISPTEDGIMSMDMEAVMRAALDGKKYSFEPEFGRVVNIAPKPEEVMPVEPVRDILHVATAPKRETLFGAPRLTEIMRTVSFVTGIPRNEIASPRRHVAICRARHLFYWIARHHTSKSYPEIGRFCGGKDHTTIMHGMAKMRKRIEDYQGDIDMIENALNVHN